MKEPEIAGPRWIRWAQVTWVVMIASAMSMFVVALLVNYSQLRQVCTAAAEQCAELGFATPAVVAQLAARDLSLEAFALLQTGIRGVFQLIPIALGFLIFARRRSEPIALLVSFFLITFGTVGMADVLAATYPALHIPAEIINLLATVSLPLFFGLFPNGRMVPRSYWAVVIYFSAGYFLQTTLDLGSSGGPLGSVWTWTGWLSVLFGGVAAQIYRYRRVSNPTEQKQTRWVLFGMGAMAVFILSLLAYPIIMGNAAIGTPDDPDFFRRFVFISILNLSFEFIFLSIGLAILRSQLFDIDIIIRKTLQYTAVTGLLATIYFGSVFLLQRLFSSVTGQASPFVLVVSTLLIAALFAPLRRRIQDAIDRRFYRKKYNAQQVLAQFARTARDETDMEALVAELERVVQETLQPEHVNVWLQPAADSRRTAATSSRSATLFDSSEARP